MQVIVHPERNNWNKILQRPSIDTSELSEQVQAVLNEVKQHGDYAVKKYTIEFDHVILDKTLVSLQEIEEAALPLLRKPFGPDTLAQAIRDVITAEYTQFSSLALTQSAR